MKTDAQLQRDVVAELAWEPSVNEAGLGVQVTQGVVTLSGHVGSHSEKWQAERAVQRVLGVQALAVDIEVRLPDDSRRSDADIARAAENVLQWTSCLPVDSVKVLVEDGWVTLSGEVAWEYQRRTATALVRHLMGVRGVSDQIGIQAMVSASDVKQDIEAALTRRAAAQARTIEVDVKGADVTLSGSVANWTERDLARHSAWGAAGVRRVVDHMSIAG